jgi:aryl-alcohol dehydrogenase-like predicted oxidoreductase
VEHRWLGRTGLRVPVLGLGTNTFGGRASAAEAERIVHAALDRGMTFIDTANLYVRGESERILGQALKGRRHEVILATKAGLPVGPGPNDRGSSRYHLIRELEASLRRLGTDYVDLFWVHTMDPHTPLEETLGTLEDLRRAGKIRYAGASNYYAWELMKALGVSERQKLVRYEASQVSYSLVDRTPEREMVPLCLDQGVGLVAYMPLASGILTGKYPSADLSQAPPGSRGAVDPGFSSRLREDRLAVAQGVRRLAQELSATPAQVAVAWLLTRPAVTSVLVGATRVSQVEENAGAAELRLPPEALEELDRLSRPFVQGEPFSISRLSD